MNKKILVSIASIMELGGVALLTYVGLKRNSDCYKAECKLAKAKTDAVRKDLLLLLKDCEIEVMRRKIESLEQKQEVES